mmetsp:Transcript_21452/g.52847  ORF Transcript_21452/g.52847 Transcript_21452/m.52847 type:complete len:308 (-) Transcript_21452:85-1008(-)|eukprot:CAMPEP_0113622636 /NCGR_PEP_ID=MMETSP0017_2-20120614/11609_1 /TAXON_ID=2856 /ORGANISM="Cylindrotheca closterium" /LENGTH=307 /DNA_ID=CAMNT_0000532491 /DNA_START=423 /DNA_END=1346 /DNA_ORIENTATION=+ /assembly_acc=CAM_ASM_000147
MPKITLEDIKNLRHIGQPPWEYGDYIICPYGHLSYIIPILSIFGTIFFCSAAFGCSLTISRSAYHEIYIGYWYRESTGFAISNGEEGDGNICVTWQNTGNLFDGLWRFGQAIGVLGFITCFLPALFDLLLLYRRLDQQWFPPLIVIHFGNALMCLLLLVGLSSRVCKNELCEMARGGVVAIFGCIWWIAAGICLLCLLRRERQLIIEEEEEKEEFLALPAPEEGKKEKEYPALPASKKEKKKKEELLALPAAQELESDSDDENEVYNEDHKRLPASQKKKSKLKELPASENEENKTKKKKKKKSTDV